MKKIDILLERQRKVVKEIKDTQEKHRLLLLYGEFLIIQNGIDREFYKWDHQYN